MMNHPIRWVAPAKLNLFLHVCGRRADGYHLIESVFELIDLCDILSFEKRQDHQIVRTSTNFDIPENEDLSIRAARALAQYMLKKSKKRVSGVNIKIIKNIPMGAGLGGGSSDAATTLMALNQLWECHLSPSTLISIGLPLGADIPFFIFGKSAFVRGIGEQLQAIKVPDLWFVVIKPPVFVSTARIFASKQLTRDTKPMIMEKFPDSCSEVKLFGKNDLQSVAVNLYPQIQEAIDDLCEFSPARMTGSGSCVFACFETKQQAEHAVAELCGKWDIRVVRGLHSHPLQLF